VSLATHSTASVCANLPCSWSLLAGRIVRTSRRRIGLAGRPPGAASRSAQCPVHAPTGCGTTATGSGTGTGVSAAGRVSTLTATGSRATRHLMGLVVIGSRLAIPVTPRGEVLLRMVGGSARPDGLVWCWGVGDGVGLAASLAGARSQRHADADEPLGTVWQQDAVAVPGELSGEPAVELYVAFAVSRLGFEVSFALGEHFSGGEVDIPFRLVDVPDHAQGVERGDLFGFEFAGAVQLALQADPAVQVEVVDHGAAGHA
jgi:hypothetical protein